MINQSSKRLRDGYAPFLTIGILAISLGFYLLVALFVQLLPHLTKVPSLAPYLAKTQIDTHWVGTLGMLIGRYLVRRLGMAAIFFPCYPIGFGYYALRRKSTRAFHFFLWKLSLLFVWSMIMLGYLYVRHLQQSPMLTPLVGRFPLCMATYLYVQIGEGTALLMLTGIVLFVASYFHAARRTASSLTQQQQKPQSALMPYQLEREGRQNV
jgi:hypothetical protein